MFVVIGPHEQTLLYVWYYSKSMYIKYINNYRIWGVRLRFGIYMTVNDNEVMIDDLP